MDGTKSSRKSWVRGPKASKPLVNTLIKSCRSTKKKNKGSVVNREKQPWPQVSCFPLGSPYSTVSPGGGWDSAWLGCVCILRGPSWFPTEGGSVCRCLVLRGAASPWPRPPAHPSGLPAGCRYLALAAPLQGYALARFPASASIFPRLAGETCSLFLNF